MILPKKAKYLSVRLIKFIKNWKILKNTQAIIKYFENSENGIVKQKNMEKLKHAVDVEEIDEKITKENVIVP